MFYKPIIQTIEKDLKENRISEDTAKKRIAVCSVLEDLTDDELYDLFDIGAFDKVVNIITHYLFLACEETGRIDETTERRLYEFLFDKLEHISAKECMELADKDLEMKKN